MLCPSPPCAHGFALDVGRRHAARRIAGASSEQRPTLAPCTAATPDTANVDLFGATTAQEPNRTPYDSTDLMLDETDNDEDGRDRVRLSSHHGALEHALGLRRPSHAGKGSLTLDGLLRYQLSVHSVRRL